MFTLAALVLGLCLPGRACAWAGGVAVVSVASDLLLSGAEQAARRTGGAHRRYHTAVMAGVAGMVAQTALRLLFLPCHAYVAASAIGTALWRMGVSKRDLLAWVTAAQTERGRDGLWLYVRAFWPSAVLGLAVMRLARLRIGMLVGLCWVLAPVVAWAISRPAARQQGLTRTDRTFLLHQAALMWGYFAAFLRPEDHFLPPDHWQEQPDLGPTRRTSPTNIGMGLLSVMAAVDLDLLPRNRGWNCWAICWRRWRSWRSGGAICTTGMTRPPCALSTPGTSQRWTAEICGAVSSRCGRAAPVGRGGAGGPGGAAV